MFTGLVNLSLDTRAQSATVAHVVMVLYLASMVSAAFLIYRNETVRTILTGHIVKSKIKVG